NRFVVALLAALAVAGAQALPAIAAETSVDTALTGVVTSAEEGAMEGVLVSAKKNGTNITITVVTDAQGRYRFPRTKLDAGQYAMRIRAAGYDLTGRVTAEVAAQQPTSLDLKLRKAQDLAAQLTNGEWIASMTGTEQQKKTLLGCVGCHTIERIARSTYDTEGFLTTVQRMGTYANQSTPLRPQKRLTTRYTDLVGEDQIKVPRAQAQWLATVNQSHGSGWDYPLKTFPRPSGRATQVIMTEYDLPRPTIEPHDVILDASGIAWYSNFGEQSIGKLDPKTGKVTEYPVPEPKKGSPQGLLSLRTDKEGNLWAGMMYQGAIMKFEPKTEKMQVWSLPPELNRANSQVNMTSPMTLDVDGKIWTQNNGVGGVHRVDLKTGTWETWEPFKASPVGHNIYDVIGDSKNNVFFTDIGKEHIGRIDAKTGKITLHETPTKASGPRRAVMDDQDRLWFAQYRGNKIGVFDTKTEKFEEWPMTVPWTQPYDVALDKNGEVWTGSMINDRIVRLDPKTGKTVDYLLPRFTNIRRVYVDNTTARPTFWVGSNHGASIIKLEPLD
ncbi:MAG TPA: carboxypeptidase regulatory-like domain-containing protein, partial [Burkholderiales bacterium]|nr:carboxypeptidase regulatory-like domain-containing protein [Burkholderiales bacterium]